MKPNHKRKGGGKNAHQWGKRLADDFNRIILCKGNELERKK